MKRTYLIQSAVTDNEEFNNRIKALGPWLKYFSDNWIVSSELSAEEIYNKLTSDGFEHNILVLEIKTDNYWGRMNTKVWEYFKERGHL